MGLCFLVEHASATFKQSFNLKYPPIQFRLSANFSYIPDLTTLILTAHAKVNNICKPQSFHSWDQLYFIGHAITDCNYVLNNLEVSARVQDQPCANGCSTHVLTENPCKSYIFLYVFYVSVLYFLRLSHQLLLVQYYRQQFFFCFRYLDLALHFHHLVIISIEVQFCFILVYRCLFLVYLFCCAPVSVTCMGSLLKNLQYQVYSYACKFYTYFIILVLA